MKFRVMLRRHLEVKPEAEQLDGKEFNFYYGWELGDDHDRYPGESAWVADDDSWPENAPVWIADGDLYQPPKPLFDLIKDSTLISEVWYMSGDHSVGVGGAGVMYKRETIVTEDLEMPSLIKQVLSISKEGVHFKLAEKVSFDGGDPADNWWISWESIGTALFESAPTDTEELDSTSQLVKIRELSDALNDANDVCRSAYQVAERGGVNTDWPALQARIAESLLRQHKVMYPHGDAI